MKSYCDIDFSKRRKKRFIQTFFYSSSKTKKSSALILCGPDLDSHVSDFKILSNAYLCSLHIYELDKKTYLKNLKDSEKYSKLKINIVNDNIINARICRFVDLDFCTSLHTNFPTIESIYNKMKNIKPYNEKVLNKHIIITFSLRDGSFGTKLEDSIQQLCDLFGISNNFKPLDLLPKSYIMKHATKDCMYSTYKDGATMCTFSYQFK
jgi:hypothetical protein